MTDVQAGCAPVLARVAVVSLLLPMPLPLLLLHQLLLLLLHQLLLRVLREEFLGLCRRGYSPLRGPSSEHRAQSGVPAVGDTMAMRRGAPRALRVIAAEQVGPS
jgi:hypothetical protein